MVKKPARKRPPRDPSQRKARGLLTVGTSLPHLAAPALRKRGFAQAKLITDWPAIVGEEMARYTVPQKLVFPRGSKTDAILHLRVASGYALELQHSAPQIIDRINGFFGYRAVSDLRYAQGPIPPQRRPRRVTPPRLNDVDEAQLQSNIGDMGDAGLRDALLRLGRAVRTGRGPGRDSGRESG
ncbi:MAG: DciA family protein [Alphaproteobacteria bacterium]|nr:DciA family protein [Alphaproteobacteria bacterium]